MKVKCIDIGYWVFLTIDKIYDVIKYDYYIIDDSGNKWRYPKELFKTLSEMRNDKINKLLEDES